MVLQEISDLLFNPILGPLLALPPTVVIMIVALVISIISVLVQRHFTDQERLKFLKKETKKIQEDIRKNKDNPEKQMKLQKKMMPIQGEMMKRSLKPTLWMMLPFLLVFFWLSMHFAFEPLLPGEPFTITAEVDANTATLEVPEGVMVTTPLEVDVTDGVASWEASAPAGLYVLTITADNSVVTKNVRIDEQGYEPVTQTYKGDITMVTLSNEKLKPIDPFTIFGWRPGWIWIYIFFSLVFSISLRKWLDVA